MQAQVSEGAQRPFESSRCNVVNQYWYVVPVVPQILAHVLLGLVLRVYKTLQSYMYRVQYCTRVCGYKMHNTSTVPGTVQVP
jgi:hypothetical protein